MKKALLIAIGLVVGLLAGCGVKSEAKHDSVFRITKETSNVYRVVDDETGVNYVVVNVIHGVAVCPRYNEDGTLYNSGQEK